MTEESCEKRESHIRNYINQSFTSCMKRQHQVTKNAIGEYQASKCSKHENETTPSRSKTLLYSKPTPRKRKQLSNSDELKFRKKLDSPTLEFQHHFRWLTFNKFCLVPHQEWAHNNFTKFEEYEQMWSISWILKFVLIYIV